MKHLVRLSLLVLVVVAASCRSTRKISTEKIQTAISKKDTSSKEIAVNDTHADTLKYIQGVVGKVTANHIDFKTFSAKMKVNYQDKDGEQPELTVTLRMYKDSAIWISVSATLINIEVFRLLITPDSVKLIDKRAKKVHLRSVNYLRELTQLPFDFYTLQELLIGNPIYFDKNIISYRKNGQSILLMSVGPLFKHLMTISDGDNLLQHSKLDDVDPTRNRTCDLTYSGYLGAAGGIRFATEREISVSERSKLDVDMNFKQYSFNETLDMKFSIPKNYKRD